MDRAPQEGCDVEGVGVDFPGEITGVTGKSIQPTFSHSQRPENYPYLLKEFGFGQRNHENEDHKDTTTGFISSSEGHEEPILTLGTFAWSSLDKWKLC